METYLIDQHLEALNLRRATTIRDSCSLFRAVAQSSHVSGDQSEHLQVRLNTLTFLAENWDRMRMFFVGQLDKTAYLQQMRLETTFAGENEMRAICVRYDVCIEVFYCDLNDCSVTSQTYGKVERPRIQLCYIPAGAAQAYYDVIVSRRSDLEKMDESYTKWRVDKIMQMRLDPSINDENAYGRLYCQSALKMLSCSLRLEKYFVGDTCTFVDVTKLIS